MTTQSHTTDERSNAEPYESQPREHHHYRRDPIPLSVNIADSGTHCRRVESLYDIRLRLSDYRR